MTKVTTSKERVNGSFSTTFLGGFSYFSKKMCCGPKIFNNIFGGLFLLLKRKCVVDLEFFNNIFGGLFLLCCGPQVFQHNFRGGGGLSYFS